MCICDGGGQCHAPSPRLTQPCHLLGRSGRCFLDGAIHLVYWKMPPLSFRKAQHGEGLPSHTGTVTCWGWEPLDMVLLCVMDNPALWSGFSCVHRIFFLAWGSFFYRGFLVQVTGVHSKAVMVNSQMSWGLQKLMVTLLPVLEAFVYFLLVLLISAWSLLSRGGIPLSHGCQKAMSGQDTILVGFSTASVSGCRAKGRCESLKKNLLLSAIDTTIWLTTGWSRMQNSSPASFLILLWHHPSTQCWILW